MTLPATNWSFPTEIRFGSGRIDELPEACRSLGIVRPLLVTDPGLAKLPIVQAALDSNAAAGVPTGLFSAIEANPVGADVDAGVVAYAKGAHDGVIAFGGGSALDVGKVIAFMAGQTRPLWDFEDREDWWSRADPDRIAPIIAVPTTAGTGSEVGRAGVIIDELEQVKKIIFHPHMMPSIVFLDPQLTVALPANVTAATGMDALAHCLEAYCAPGFHPMADGIAAEGVRLVREWLAEAVRDGGNLDARGGMLIAAMMGATAFQKGLGAMHALSHPIGALYKTHHGLTNAVLMPYVLQFNRKAIDGRMARLAGFAGLPQASFDALLDWVLELRRELSIPHSLLQIGVTEDQLDRLALMAEADPSAAGNPLPFGAAEARRLLERAMSGELAD